ncbi:MAG: glutamate--tRNA ligase [Alphaproteobacteria bacterium]
MSVITRFAPSPTGYLHIGGARTALFNWLYARHHSGRFLLRIENTDRKRSTPEAVQAILDGLTWLGLEWDGEVQYQLARAERHAEVAGNLLAAGKAYRCYATPEELAEMRGIARAEGRHFRYDGRWRDRDPAQAPAGVAPAIRLKAPREGETVIRDQVQGEVRVAHEELDDMVLLRADGTPTYMLSVVVDDHDSGITDVIRGDDHLTNAARQSQLFEALGWTAPRFAHLPLIHGADGARLSKRHGALGLEAYREQGFLPGALRNYLLRLGWSHGDDEIISTEQAIAWFNLEAIGRGPARFDSTRLESLNGHYLRHTPDGELTKLVAPRLAAELGRELGSDHLERLRRALPVLKLRAKTLVELAENALFLVADRPLAPDQKAARVLDPEARRRLARLRAGLAETGAWTVAALEQVMRGFADAEKIKLRDLAQPMRAALTGSVTSPGIFDVMVALGRDESLGRIDDAAA